MDRSGQCERISSPALLVFSDEHAAFRTMEFLGAGIGNAHTRRAYHRAAQRFLIWCNARGLRSDALRSPDVAAYINELGATLARLSVKQHLAALKHWFDWLVTGHLLQVNPAHAMRGPRYSQNTGKTPILDKQEARALLDSIDASDVMLMLFSSARIGARRDEGPRLSGRGHGAGDPALARKERQGEHRPRASPCC